MVEAFEKLPPQRGYLGLRRMIQGLETDDTVRQGCMVKLQMMLELFLGLTGAKDEKLRYGRELRGDGAEERIALDRDLLRILPMPVVMGMFLSTQVIGDDLLVGVIEDLRLVVINPKRYK